MTPRRPWQIEWHAELQSTMDHARALAESGAPSGTVVVADYQSEGRGTRGRRWLAPTGSCLMFTLVARPGSTLAPPELEHLPARVSASIAAALRQEYGLDCTLKQPNDILSGGRKLCGVLCTSRITGEAVDWVLCGVGLNTHMTPEQLPLPSATSLAIEGLAVPDHRALLDTLLTQLDWLLER